MLDQAEFAGLSSILVGRAEESRLLDHHTETARAGQPGLVIVSGPAGIGKSSLLAAFLAGDACRGVTALHAVCGPATASSAYGAVRELFGPLRLGGEDAENAEGAEEAEEAAGAADSPLLRGVAPRARSVLGADPAGEGQRGQDLSGPPAAYQVLYGLYRLAANVMAERPLVLVLDDVHQCDEHSLRWIDFLLRRADDLPLLVVLARRSEHEPAAPAALAEITAQRRPAVLRLAPLTYTDVGEMVRRILPLGAGTHVPARGQPPAPAAAVTAATADPAERTFVEQATAVSGGNPRTLGRLLDALRAEGVRPDEHGVGRVAEVGGEVAADSVQGLLDRQPPWVRDVATAVAVLGEESADLVGPLVGVAPTLVARALLILRCAGFVAPDRTELIHDSLRSAVLEPIGAHGLAQLRTRAALLLSDAGRPAEHAAGQLMLLPALPQSWMPDVLRDAADQAGSRGAPDTAVRYLYRVLEAEPDSVRLRLQMAKSLAESDPPHAIRLLDEALARSDDIRTKAKVAVQYGMTCLAVQKSRTGVRVVEEALTDLDAGLGTGTCPVDPADRELRTQLESVLLIVGAREKTTISTVRDRAERLTAPPGDTPAERQMLSMMTVLNAMGGHSAEQTVEQARRALRFQGCELESWLLITSAFALTLADEVGEALDALDRLLQYGQDNGAVWTYVAALSARALLLHNMGAIPDALADAQTSIEIITQENWRDSAPLAQAALATVLVDRGEPERAEELLAGIKPPSLDRFVIEHHWYLMARARARRALGDPEAALGLYLRCGESLAQARFTNPAFLPWWAEAACLLAGMNRADEAREIIEYSSELAARWGTPRVRGLAVLADGMTTPGGAGVELITESVRLLADSPARGEHAKAEYLLGRALLKTGDQRAAREHLRTAADLAQRCGALALAGDSRKLLVTAGGRMRKMSACPLDMLTAMERRVAGLAADGASNRSIAESLFVTVRTVETHLTSVYRKLGVSRRTELGAVLHTPDIPDRQPPGWAFESRRQS
ncbi:helix-turn-helix transcriptional regulator [Streptomyces sp. NBC_00370]|uniref:helix-turn-helix transcriptional regulator n=1 Tax=Streptomyces sp. NBC_00370 TaxID=2975728 RepID=UPI002E269947